MQIENVIAKKKCDLKMKSEIIRSWVPKAQRNYHCDNCECLIHKGTKYLRIFSKQKTWGKITTSRHCIKCAHCNSDPKVINALKKANINVNKES